MSLGFELWFKQIIWEIDSLRVIFGNKIIDETHMFVSINRLQRCVQIWHLLCDQISILETMTPLDFMEFRSYLSPASGFQSLQFRLIENKLGLKDKSRVVYNQLSYKNTFPSAREQRELVNSLDEATLFTLIEVKLFFDCTSNIQFFLFSDGLNEHQVSKKQVLIFAKNTNKLLLNTSNFFKQMLKYLKRNFFSLKLIRHI
jgi:tryptophan 2,3-dioxygenase